MKKRFDVFTICSALFAVWYSAAAYAALSGGSPELLDIPRFLQKVIKFILTLGAYQEGVLAVLFAATLLFAGLGIAAYYVRDDDDFSTPRRICYLIFPCIAAVLNLIPFLQIVFQWDFIISIIENFEFIFRYYFVETAILYIAWAVCDISFGAAKK